MAHIYFGDTQSMDQEVLNKLGTLSDDYWVYGGFNVGREVDWLVIRADETEHSAIIVTELKRYEYPIRGISQDAQWERSDSTGAWFPIESNNDRNPYWQAVNTANTIKSWLWNNQNLYLGGDGALSEDEFSVWPEILILSQHGVRHQLPLRPTSRYGAWIFDVDRWLGALQTWRPRKGVCLSAAQCQALASLLGLQGVSSAPVESAPLTVEQRLAQLEQRMSALERRG